MNKSIIYKVIFILAVVLILGVAFGYFYLKEKSGTKTEPSPVASNTVSPSPTPDIPKVTSFEVPILMYHYIRDASGESELGQNLSVAPKTFDTQLKWFADNGYISMQVRDLSDPDEIELSKIQAGDKKPFIITFDDGYADAYTNALPVLQKYKMTATFYIIRNYVGKAEYMNQTQIDKLASFGFEIGSHSLSHPDLTKASPEEAERQISESKGKAETFCYPSGRYDQTTVALLKSAGYLAAVTTKSGIANQDSNLFELPRIRVTNQMERVLK